MQFRSFLTTLGGGNAADYAKALAGSGGKKFRQGDRDLETYVATHCT